MKYEVHAIEDDDKNVFHCVYEKATEQAFDFYLFLDDAKEVANFLETGGAFDGFTPSFMLIQFTTARTKDDINAKFAEIA
jgi:hypothetical protein